MKQRQLGVRPGPSFKVRKGKNGHVRKNRADRCKLAAAAAATTTTAAAEQAEPSTSKEAGEHGPGHSALLVEEGMCVMVLAPGQKLTFTGKCVLTCLYGSVEVLGLTINSNEKSYELFSPKTHAPLTIEGRKQKKASKTRKEIRMEARQVLRAYLSLDFRRAVMKMFKTSYSILLLERLEDTASSYILSHLDYSKIYGKQLRRKPSSKTDDAVLHSIGVQSCDPATGVCMCQDAVSAAQKLVHACLEENIGCPIILVCGPQNVGKSTFNRYLINQLLNRIPCVGYLDCDLGQTEFTPPGCISLLSIDEPVLGPPYTHQRNPDKMVYFGETSCEQEIDRFIESVKYVVTYYKRDQPLIINTMGWVKGFGLLLLIDLIHLLSPTHIVQMRAADGYIMEALTSQFVKNSSGFMTKGQSHAQCQTKGLDFSDEEDSDNMDGFHFRTSQSHQLITIESDFLKAGDGENMLCHNWILRDIAMLGYISKLQQSDLEEIIPLHSLLPYEVPFNAVALRVIHSDVAPSHIMYTANASWVGLCHILDDVRSQDGGPVILSQTPICDCLGFGIVRGVNMAKKVYHILTPVPPEILPEVNCLLIGNISIPHSIFKHQPGIKGDIPYVTSEYDFSIYGSGKLRLKKNLKRREHV